jgi:ElaB/YqjD/DUF883 family membrane-anchored ribosome-binding protein
MGLAQDMTQLPADAFEQGLVAGRVAAQRAVRRVAAWAEENPGQMLLVAAGAGFLIGALLLRKPRVPEEPLARRRW